MNKKKLEKFRKILTNQKNEILEEADKTASGLAKVKEAGEYYADLTDLATADQDQNFELRMRDRERRLLKKINEALFRIESGDFGVCDECGENIEEKRLMARPVTTLCVNCKSIQELEEKKRGE